jgi:activating signal cointegrator 1
MKGLTLTQPWATLIALGAKRIETRSWQTSYRGELAIHAGKGLGEFGSEAELWIRCLTDPFRAVLTAGGYANPGQLPRGKIVAVVDLGDCVPTVGDGHIECRGLPDRVSAQERAFGNYARGRFGWLLDALKTLPEPVPCRGAQGLWNVPAEVQAQIRAQLVETPRGAEQ